MDGAAHPADGGRAHLGKLHGDARLSAAGQEGAHACALASGPLGIAATLAANVAHGLGHGLIGSAVAAWPAVALVGSYELLMMIIRGAQSAASAAVPAAADAAPELDLLGTRAAEEFAAEVAAGRTPSIRAIRVRLHVGQSRTQQVQAHLGTLMETGETRQADLG